METYFRSLVLNNVLVANYEISTDTAGTPSSKLLITFARFLLNGRNEQC